MAAGGSLSRRKRRHFFKIMLGDFAKKLHIPPAFMKHVAMEAPKEIVLQGPSGELWPVKLGQGSNNKTYLHDGWQEFVKDHSLQEFDLLVFRYDSRSHFTVQIFDKTACERDDALKAERSGQKYSGGKRRDKQVRLSNTCFSYAHQCQHNSNTEALDSKHIIHDLKKLLPDSSAYVMIKQETFELGRSDLHVCGRLSATEEEKANYLDHFNSFTSENPFFKLRLKKVNLKHGYLVAVPAAFAKANLPRTTSRIVLQDQSKKSWPITFVVNGYNNCLSAGWITFARDNGLRDGELLIFELVAASVMQVHIFRSEM